MNLKYGLRLMVAASGVALLIGCGEHASKQTGTTQAGKPASTTVAPATPQLPLHQELTSLSTEDRALAQRQRVCPVSGELLGSMGPVVKVTVEGRIVFLCCSGCEDDLRKDPQK